MTQIEVFAQRLRKRLGHWQTRQSPSQKTRDLPLLRFIPSVSPRLDPPTHLAPFVRAIESTLSESKRLIVSTPPQHGKTEAAIHGLVWRMLRKPYHRNAYVTYERRRAEDVSLRVQHVASEAGLELLGSRRCWRTSRGGGLLATGIGGPLTGYAVDGMLIVDDPVKNRSEAESATIRERTLQWFRDVALTRVHPGGSVIVIQTRWHPDDLAGHLIREGWPSINLQAERDGLALWPRHRPLEHLLKIRSEVGEYTWASLYQGQPRPRSGRLFIDAYYYDTIPQGFRCAIGVDFAYTSKTQADYSVSVVLAEHEGYYYVLDVRRAQCRVPEFARRLKLTQRQFPGATLHAYVGGTEIGVVDLLRADHGVPIATKTAKNDKFIRAQGYSAAWNAGRVLLPRNADWVEQFVAEHAGFTGVNDDHDDQIDAVVAAFDHLHSNQPYQSLTQQGRW